MFRIILLVVLVVVAIVAGIVASSWLVARKVADSQKRARIQYEQQLSNAQQAIQEAPELFTVLDAHTGQQRLLTPAEVVVNKQGENTS